MAKAETTKVTRTKRIPVGGTRDVLSLSNKDPNYAYRWVNDVPGRIQRFQEGGWEIVNHEGEVGSNAVDRGSRLGSAVTKMVGGNMTAVAMRIPKEWFDEDQAAKQSNVDAIEKSMRADAHADYGTLTIKRK